jgi:hypothetical protein
MQEVVNDVSSRHSQVMMEFDVTFAGIDLVRKENQKLEGEKRALEIRQKDLENRERLWSMGFFTALGVVVVTLATLLPKFATMKLDRTYRKLEIEQKLVEIENLRIKKSDNA